MWRPELASFRAEDLEVGLTTSSVWPRCKLRKGLHVQQNVMFPTLHPD